MFLCPICLKGACEIRWNKIHNALELHCLRCQRGTKILSEDSVEVH